MTVILASDREDVRKHARPWYLQGSAAVLKPFSTLGLAWCPRCQEEVDTDTAAGHQGTVYVHRQRCLRCGRVIAFGVYKNVPLLNGEGLPPAALEWVTKPGKDRR